MKLGIIRCMQTEDYCPGAGCFKAIREHGGSFENIDEGIEIVGFTNWRLPGQESRTTRKNACRTRCRHDSLRVMHTQGNSYRLSLPVWSKDEGPGRNTRTGHTAA